MQMSDTIMVVGGTGFLGRYVVRALVEQGFRVKVIARHASVADALKPSGDLGQIAIISGDITQPESIAPHLAGCRAVVNLVGLMFESGGKQNFQHVHAVGAEKLAQAAHAAGVQQFVQVSALGVDKASVSAYAHTKRLGEKAVQSAFQEAVILRPSVMFGVEDNFFNQFGQMAMASPILPLIGGGKTHFQPVYVGNVAQAIVTAITQPQLTNRKIFELVGPEVLSFKAILEMILKLTNRKARLVNLPFGLAKLIGKMCEWLPNPPLTSDQVTLLKHDNIASGNLPGLSDLGIEATPVETIVPGYLARFKRHGGQA